MFIGYMHGGEACVVFKGAIEVDFNSSLKKILRPKSMEPDTGEKTCLKKSFRSPKQHL